MSELFRKREVALSYFLYFCFFGGLAGILGAALELSTNAKASFPEEPFGVLGGITFGASFTRITSSFRP